MQSSRLLYPVLCAVGVASACAAKQPPTNVATPTNAVTPTDVATPTRPSVMILSTYHMTNQGLDAVNAEADDVLSARRQKEIAEVIELLAAYAPTKIALEATPEHAVELNALYSSYRRGEYQLSRNEREQIGFRLAARLGHDQIYGVDAPFTMPFGEAMAAGERNGQSHLLQRIQAAADEGAAELQAIIDNHTVREILLFDNSEEREATDGVYMLMAQLGSTAEPAGAKMVAGWYERNLLIYANVARLVESEQERILVLFGAGHGKLLREFVAESPNLELVHARAYLGDR